MFKPKKIIVIALLTFMIASLPAYAEKEDPSPHVYSLNTSITLNSGQTGNSIINTEY